MTDQFDEGSPAPESESADSEQMLRAMLAGLDPMSARVPVDAPTSPRARHLLEQIMTSTPTTESAPIAKVSFLRRPRTFLAAAASIAVLALGTTVAVNAGGSGPGESISAAPTSIALAVPGGGPSIGSCLMFDVEFLRQMSVALAGTVTSTNAQGITIDVDRWYKGGDADQVSIAIPEGQTTVALDGVDFVVGERFLITATEGVVNGCGFSGPATPDLEKSFNEAFPG